MLKIDLLATLDPLTTYDGSAVKGSQSWLRPALCFLGPSCMRAGTAIVAAVTSAGSGVVAAVTLGRCRKS